MRKYLLKKIIVAVLSLVLSASMLLTGCGDSGSKADNSWDKVKEKGEFVLGLDESFPPMGFKDDKGEIVGFDIDTAREVCSRLGVELKIQPISWDAKEQELNTGNIDCIWNGFTITDERKENVLFTKPYMNNRQVLVVKEDSPYNDIKDLEGKKLGLQSESSAVDALDANEDFKAKLKEVILFDENMMAIMDLEKGGVDALLIDEIVIRYYMQTKGNNFKIFDKELSHEEYGVGFRKGDKKLMKKVEETLEAMSKDGKLTEISTKWFDRDIVTIKK
ncbi:MAG TPA: amino acid ABC transporter substrate-binding protein [Clostridiales bacterium]|nr:amino acid ABC transporter substrate-binding protein [Clostridiales bacterium]